MKIPFAYFSSPPRVLAFWEHRKITLCLNLSDFVQVWAKDCDLSSPVGPACLSHEMWLGYWFCKVGLGLKMGPLSILGLGIGPLLILGLYVYICTRKQRNALVLEDPTAHQSLVCSQLGLSKCGGTCSCIKIGTYFLLQQN